MEGRDGEWGWRMKERGETTVRRLGIGVGGRGGGECDGGQKRKNVAVAASSRQRGGLAEERDQYVDTGKCVGTRLNIVAEIIPLCLGRDLLRTLTSCQC